MFPAAGMSQERAATPPLGRLVVSDALPDLLASRRDPLTASEMLLLWFVKDAV